MKLRMTHGLLRWSEPWDCWLLTVCTARGCENVWIYLEKDKGDFEEFYKAVRFETLACLENAEPENA